MLRLVLSVLVLVTPSFAFAQEAGDSPLRTEPARQGLLGPGASRWFSLSREAGKAYRVEAGDPGLEVACYDKGREKCLRRAGGGLHVPASEEAGRCWIRVTNPRSEARLFRLTWARFTPAPDDQADGPERATPLRLGAEKAGAIEDVSDEDWFRIELEAKRTYQVQLETHSGGPLRLELLDADGGRQRDTVLVRRTPQRVFWRPLRAGTFTLRVSDPQNNPAQSYTLTWDLVRDDHGDTAAEAHEIGPDGVAIGALESYEDEDWFRLQLVPGRRYVIGYAGAFRVQLYAADGRQITEGRFGSLGAFVPQDAGPYYLRVPPDWPGRYRLHVREVR